MNKKSPYELMHRLWNSIIEPFDPWIMLFLGLIYILSLLVLYSADNQDLSHITSKAVCSIFALVIMWFIARCKSNSIMNFALPIYIIGLVLLIGVHFFGISVNGSQRWLNIGVTRIQPSEIMKISIPIILATYFHKSENTTTWKHYLISCILIAIPATLVLKQPDLGTAILISASGFFVVYFAELPWKALIGGALLSLFSMPFIWIYVMHDYQRQRILMLIDPMKDPLGAGYHVIQSMIAIGSGGFLGKGWLNGTQTHLDYIPERTTDFIFAVFAEEFGLLGNIILLLLYLLLISRGIMIAARAETIFNRLLASALTMTLAFYIFVNIGMVSGILPVVGVPLPLVSYGGTATLTVFICQGLLMNIANKSKRHLKV